MNNLDTQVTLIPKYTLYNEDAVKYDEFFDHDKAVQMLREFPNDYITVTLVPIVPSPIGSDK